MTTKKDLTGQKFGKLTVTRDSGERRRKAVVWDCECECGGKARVTTALLLSGKTKSCGCLHGAHLKADYDVLNGVY